VSHREARYSLYPAIIAVRPFPLVGDRAGARKLHRQGNFSMKPNITRITTPSQLLEFLNEIDFEFRSNEKRLEQLIVQHFNTKDYDLKQLIASDLFKEFGIKVSSELADPK
jgi:hypothetical protein